MWTVPKIWAEGDVYIIGGGSSLTKQFEIPEEVVDSVKYKKQPLSVYSPYMQKLHDKHVIGVNVAFLLGDWVDMVFFGDNKFYLAYREKIAVFPGLKVTCHAHFRNNKYGKEYVKYLMKHNNQPKGISTNPKKVSWNANSGAAAISVATNAGAKRIILLGFDMKLDEDGFQHCHTEYRNKDNLKSSSKKALPFARHLRGFGAIQQDAEKRGIEILNASENSRIKVFRKVNVKDLI